MKNKNKVYWFLPIALLFIILGISVSASVHSLGRKTGSNGAYTYQINERKDGYIEAKIHVIPQLDSAEFQGYVQANEERIRNLIHQGGEPIDVQVTLKRPLAADEIQLLASETTLQVESFLLVGKGTNNEQVTSIIYGDLSEIPSREEGPRGQSVEYLGVMVLQGKIVPSISELGKLSADNRIYMVDTTMSEVRELIQNDSRLSGQPIESISAPSPFWELMWGPES